MVYTISGNNMTLKEVRNNCGLTQHQVADLFGVSLRSYKSYENDKEKENTIKYKYFIDELSKISFIDEEHGILSIDTIKKLVGKVLAKYDVNFCYLFGSYAKNKQNESSDVDLLIDSSVTGLEFYGLVEELRTTLCKKVDLLNIDQLDNNQPLLKEILKDGIRIYG